MEDWRKSTTWFCGKCCGLLTSPDHPTGISSHSYLHLCSLVSWLLVRRSFHLFVFSSSLHLLKHYHYPSLVSGHQANLRCEKWIVQGPQFLLCSWLPLTAERHGRVCFFSGKRWWAGEKVQWSKWHFQSESLIESGRTDQAMCTEGPSSKWEIDYREWKAWMRGGVRLGGGITVPILAMAPKWL